MRTLIVGCGYVGTVLGTELVRFGHTVHGLRRTAGSNSDLQTAGIIPLLGDVTKRDDLAKMPANYDWVINCVSSSGGGADDYQAVYLQGTRNVLEWLSPTPPKKFVYTSSTSVYAQTDGSLVTETSPTEPASETARVLLETENLLLKATLANFPAVILRVAGIYGPGRGYWFKRFFQGEAKIEGNGERFLNMVHRDDVAGAIIAALKNGRPGEIYNVVDDEPVTQIEQYRWLAATSGRDIPPFAELELQANRKRGWTNKRISNRKLKSELAYQFKYPTFRQGFTAL